MSEPRESAARWLMASEGIRPDIHRRFQAIVARASAPPSDAPSAWPRPRYVPHPHTKLSPRTVSKIRQLRDEGLRLMALSRRFHVSCSTIQRAVTRQTWRTVAMLAVTFALAGTLASVERADEVVAKLRELAEVAGCQKEDVRVALRWKGQGRPMEVKVWCETPRGDKP